MSIINVKPFLISVISAVYMGEDSVERLCAEITTVLDELGLNFEIILVDDSSPDDSWQKIKKLSNIDTRIKGILLSKNYGQHYAITAGFDEAKGDYVAVIDCDLEDHPKYLKDLILKMREGNNIVFARRINKKHSIRKRLLSKLFSVVLNLVADAKHDSAIGTFSMLDKRAADAFRSYREHLRTYTLIVYQLGFKVGFCDIEHSSRLQGKSSYSLRKLITLSLHAIITSTEKPLYVISIVGLFLSIFSLFFIAFLVLNYFSSHVVAPGWSSIIASIYLVGGFVIFSIGVNGIYLGKCFRESLKRPLYHIREFT